MKLNLRWTGWVLLAVALITGFLFANDYGISTDEPVNYKVGLDALRSYTSWQGYQDYMAQGEALAQHGPSYFMVYAAGAGFFAKLVPGWQIEDARHWINFLAFLLGCLGVYWLSRRFMSQQAALVTTVFLGTQPLLLGHAFINQKDTPFLVFFTLSVASGMWAVDKTRTSLQAESPKEEQIRSESFRARLHHDWRQASVGRRITALSVAAIGFIEAVDVLFLGRQIGLAQRILASAYKGEAWSPVQRLFTSVATDAYKTPLSLYLSKLDWAYWIGRSFLLMAVLAVLIWLVRWIFPESLGAFLRSGRAAVAALLSGAVLGYAVAIRPIGGFAAVLVALYALHRLRLRGIPFLAGYGVAAAFVTYLTWPYLWNAPLNHLIESLTFVSNFDKPTLYDGRILRSSQLPWTYFPKLAAITLTEPFALLFVVGLPLALRRWRLGQIKGIGLLILALWAGVPLFGLIALKMTIYDNIRHLHFVLVPFFITAGIGISFILEHLWRSWMKAGAIVLLLLPALLGIVHLHPYEYAYYNSFVGGVNGAAGRYTMDRLCTSYREAMAYVDSVASPNTVVAALNSPDVARPFARKDIKVSYEYERPPADASYLLTCSFFVGGYLDSPDWRRVDVVGRGKAVFAEVYKRIQAP